MRHMAARVVVLLAAAGLCANMDNFFVEGTCFGDGLEREDRETTLGGLSSICDLYERAGHFSRWFFCHSHNALCAPSRGKRNHSNWE